MGKAHILPELMKEYDIFAIDDNQIYLNEIVGHLERQGYRVDSAKSQEEVDRKKSEGRKYRLGIVDKRVPKAEGGAPDDFVGREIAKALGCPKIMITGYPEYEDLKKAKEAGVVGYLTKDTSLSQLDRKINEVLSQTATEVAYKDRGIDVLVVSKDLYLTELTGDILGKSGFGYQSCDDADLALEKIAAGEVGMVIGDSRMDGSLDFLRRLKDFDQDLPAIFACDPEQYKDRRLDDVIWLFDGIVPVRPGYIQPISTLGLYRTMEELSCRNNGLIPDDVPPIPEGEMGWRYRGTGIFGGGKDTLMPIVAARVPSFRVYPRFVAGRGTRDSEKEGVNGLYIADEKFDRFMRRAKRLDGWLSKNGKSRQDMLARITDPYKTRYIFGFYQVKGTNTRVSTDMPLPLGTDWGIPENIQGYESSLASGMDDGRSIGVCFWIDEETSIERQLRNRPVEDALARIPDTMRSAEKCGSFFPDKDDYGKARFDYMLVTQDMSRTDASREQIQKYTEGASLPGKLTPVQELDRIMNLKRISTEFINYIGYVRKTGRP